MAIMIQKTTLSSSGVPVTARLRSLDRLFSVAELLGIAFSEQ